ncbi:thiamine diphosphokinase [Rhodobacteraceae bacterium NNCM2]|nr:thiamine diphosphokinase [Coraliihabitans acroporae]
MTTLPVKFGEPVTLVGGGALDAAMLEAARRIAPRLVAADGAANRLTEMRLVPEVVIGDMDSIRQPHGLPPETRLIELAEQETTDFEKCLYATEAPFYLAAGFTGRRVDHMMAVLHAMLRNPHKPVILIGENEVSALVPAEREIRLRAVPGSRVSFVPLLPVTGTLSRGLEWPINGLSMEMGRQIGTSNKAIAEHVAFGFDGPGALVMLDRSMLPGLVAAVTG